MFFFKNLPEELKHEIVLFWRDPYTEIRRKLTKEVRLFGMLHLFRIIENTSLFVFYYKQQHTIFKKNYQKNKKNILDLSVFPDAHKYALISEIFNRKQEVFKKKRIPIGFKVKLRACLVEYMSY